MRFNAGFACLDIYYEIMCSFIFIFSTFIVLRLNYWNTRGGNATLSVYHGNMLFENELGRSVRYCVTSGCLLAVDCSTLIVQGRSFGSGASRNWKSFLCSPFLFVSFRFIAFQKDAAKCITENRTETEIRAPNLITLIYFKLNA